MEVNKSGMSKTIKNTAHGSGGSLSSRANPSKNPFETLEAGKKPKINTRRGDESKRLESDGSPTPFKEDYDDHPLNISIGNATL